MTPEEFLRDSILDAARLANECLDDPDLKIQSNEFKNGYRRGFTEAFAVVSKTLLDQRRSGHPQ